MGVIIFLSALITGLQASLIEKTLGSQAHIVVRPPEEMPRLLADGRVAGTDPAALARDLAPGEDAARGPAREAGAAAAFDQPVAAGDARHRAGARA